MCVVPFDFLHFNVPFQEHNPTFLQSLNMWSIRQTTYWHQLSHFQKQIYLLTLHCTHHVILVRLYLVSVFLGGGHVTRLVCSRALETRRRNTGRGNTTAIRRQFCPSKHVQNIHNCPHFTTVQELVFILHYLRPLCRVCLRHYEWHCDCIWASRQAQYASETDCWWRTSEDQYYVFCIYLELVLPVVYRRNLS